MSPKKKTTTAAVTGDTKTTRQRKKCVAKKSSKVCKGADIESSPFKDVKPLKRGKKTKLSQIKIGVKNKLVIAQTASDTTNNEDGSSSNNEPVAKKRRITQKPKTKPMVTRKSKKCAQVKTREEDNAISKKFAINRKVIPNDLKIVRTIVNDYVPDAPENIEDTVMTATNTTTKCVDVPKDEYKIKIPIVILKKILTKNESNNITSYKSEKTLENNNLSNTTNEVINCKDNLDLSSNTTSLQDVSPTKGLCQESVLDKLCFLDHYISKLHQYNGYSYEKNVDLSRKKLHFNIQTQELKNVKCGGIIPTNASCRDCDGKESVSVKANEEKCNITHDQTTKGQILGADIEVTECDPVSPDRHRFNSADDDDSDDDTISLYAESLSGFETNPKMSYASNIDKCEPIVNDIMFKIPKPVVPKPCIQICEKQKADSTSVGLLEVSRPKVDPPKVEYTKPEKKCNNYVTTQAIKSRILFPVVSGLHTSFTFVKSAVFKGICIFNIMNNCKKSNCNFPHTVPTATFVSEKLIELTQDQFYQECLMVCKKAQLLRLYGLIYINEGIRRQDNKMVIELVFSFLVIFECIQEEKQLIIEVVERTLLYLNQVNLTEITDFLNLEYTSGVQVCDKFFEVIGQTQNFSRFKIVFVKLTILMCGQNRTFKSDVVSQILERVCILPYSFDLARALIDIMKRTDARVFCNSMINVFENKLLNCDKELHQEFVKLKEVALSSNQCTRSIDDGDKLWNIADKTIRYSPDTTNKDTLDRHEHMDLRSPDLDQSHQSKTRQLGYSHVHWGSPGPINQFPRNPYRTSPTLQTFRPRYQSNRRQRWAMPNGQIPFQNKHGRKSNGPFL